MNSRKVGQNVTITLATIGLVIAYLLLCFLSGGKNKGIENFIWMFTPIDFLPCLLLGIFGIYIGAFFFGRICGYQIIDKNRNSILIGNICALLILLTGTLMGSTWFFFREGIKNIGTDDNPFFDYYFKPLYWIFFFGTIPILILGTILGLLIRRKKIQQTRLRNNNIA